MKPEPNTVTGSAELDQVVRAAIRKEPMAKLIAGANPKDKFSYFFGGYFKAGWSAFVEYVGGKLDSPDRRKANQWADWFNKVVKVRNNKSEMDSMLYALAGQVWEEFKEREKQ